MVNYSQLPESAEVSAATLSRIFGEVTNSYKFLFFLALLENAERTLFDACIPLSIDDIILDMLVLAWYPHVYSRLSFGKQDKIILELEQLAPRSILADGSLKPSDRHSLRKILAAGMKSGSTKLGRYVPYRLIRPFFPETRGMEKDSQVNSAVAELSAEYFLSRKPPYRFSDSEKELILHPEWCAYFRCNLAVVRGWAWWYFLEYMQSCNPNVPAISRKLTPPLDRETLDKQAKFWRQILDIDETRCIYSGEILRSDDFALDHFVPWSFVVHNQLWNLIPTSKTVNSKKSDKLPALFYLPRLIDSQYKALSLSRELMSPKIWSDCVSCFIADLGITDFEALRSRDSLKRGFESTVLPLLQLAEANGFEPNWRYAG